MDDDHIYRSNTIWHTYGCHKSENMDIFEKIHDLFCYLANNRVDATL